MQTVLHVVGARPNFMKAAPVIGALRAYPRIRQVLVNTGQHYDDSMAGQFFTEFQLPTPDRDLGVGSGTHAAQTAAVMRRFEEVCRAESPDMVVVFGDINSTMAATLVAAKLHIPVTHVEAGLRSFDRAMPEEINRIVTDRLAALLLTPSSDADQNLRDEGVPEERIRLVGNVMIDTVFRFLPVATLDRVRSRLPVEDRGYAVVTLHRPSNVDRAETLGDQLSAIRAISERMPVVFSVHPRTRARLEAFGLADSANGILMTEPMGYVDFLSLTSNARLILRHLLPNVAATIVVLATIGLGAAILAESALSFLGFGVPPPYPSWGAMLSGSGRTYMFRAPWMALWPGIAISLAVFGFNMLGDALRDVLDPRLRGTGTGPAR